MVVTRFNAAKPGRQPSRWRAWILWLSFVFFGMAMGLWRTPFPYARPQGAREAQTAEKPGSGAVSRATPGIQEPAARQVKLATYTVQPGDTLTSIARMFNSSADSIAYINSIASPDRISVGKELSVMVNVNGLAVRVSSGDTLWDISRRYSFTVADIAEANNLASTDEIKVGQLLLLPGAISPRPVQTASRSSSFIWPADGSVTSSFGWRIHPISGEELFHEGMDIAAYTGANVYAAASGTVAYCGWYGGYGRLIMIKHADGLETRYGHLSGYAVSEGDEIATGELIGYAGESGSTTGPNLHFEIRRSGKPVNPRDYLP